MLHKSLHASRYADLRSKAVSRLAGRSEPEGEAPTVPPAYGVLHKLATSPSTAPDALALLHELQVHQVELELQAEETWSAYAQLEATLNRQRQLYESAPVGCFTVEFDTVLIELNATGAQLLASERDLLLGHPLHGFLLPDSARRLQALIRRVSEGQQVEACTLQMTVLESKARTVHATVNADPAGRNFLVVFMDAGAQHSAPTDSPAR
jgi:PAS domain-containing protein